MHCSCCVSGVPDTCPVPMIYSDLAVARADRMGSYRMGSWLWGSELCLLLLLPAATLCNTSHPTQDFVTTTPSSSGDAPFNLSSVSEAAVVSFEKSSGVAASPWTPSASTPNSLGLTQNPAGYRQLESPQQNDLGTNGAAHPVRSRAGLPVRAVYFNLGFGLN